MNLCDKQTLRFFKGVKTPVFIIFILFIRYIKRLKCRKCRKNITVFFNILET